MELWDLVVTEFDSRTRRAVDLYGGTVIARAGVVGQYGSLPPSNCLVYDDGVDLHALVQDLESHRAVTSLTVVDTHPDVASLPERRWTVEERFTMMVLPTRAHLVRTAPPHDLTIRRVAIPEDVPTFWSAMEAGFEDEPGNAAFWLPERLLTTERHYLFVAQIDGEVVGTSGGRIANRAANIFAVSVRRDFRRRSIGGALTAAAVESVFDAGAEFVTLSASAAGCGVYRRVGFDVAGTVTVHVR